MRTQLWLAVGVCVALLALAAVLYVGAPGGRAGDLNNPEPEAQARNQLDASRPIDPLGAQPIGELAATESPAADTGATPATPADAPPAAAQPTGEDPPAEAPRDFLAASHAPLLRWDLTAADYKRIMESPDSTEEERLEARARLMGGFADWPGRDVPRLGGFAFKPGDYRLLDGFKVEETMGIRVHLHGTPPTVSIERRIALLKDQTVLQVHIRVFPSREWAQYRLLGTFVQLIHGSGHRGLKHGVEVGDVCRVSPERNGGASGIEFVRHNVFVDLDLTLDRNAFAGSILPLATEIDTAIQAQSHRARTWEDLAPHRPRIEAFRPTIAEIRPEPTPWTGHREQRRLPNTAQLEIRVSGKNIKLYCQPEAAAYRERVLGVDTAEDPKCVVASIQSKLTEPTTFDLWLVAYDDSLLFSTAAAAITVHPPEPPK